MVEEEFFPGLWFACLLACNYQLVKRTLIISTLLLLLLHLRTNLVDFLARMAKQGPLLAVFWEFPRCEDPKWPEKLVERTLYLYSSYAFDRLGF